MFTSLRNSWELVKASWQVLRADRELLVFPLVSFFVLMIVSISFIIPAVAAGIFDQSSGVPILGVIIGFLFYLVSYTITFFFNTALVGAALIRLDGGDPTLQDGINIAMSRLGKIIGYAAIASTVGLILNWLRDQGFIGQIVSGLVGFAWNIATFLVVPVLVIENVGPIEAVKRSAGLLRQTWGEQIVGNVGIGLVFGLITVAVIFLIGMPLVFVGIASGSVLVAIITIALAVLAVGAVILIGSALQGIYVAAVYKYATAGVTVEYFDPELVQNAFKPKQA